VKRSLARLKPRVAWLALLPVVGFLSGGILSQHVRALVFGVPFLLLWNATCVLATSAILTLVHECDPANREGDA
jgi:hypothetical protein